MFAYNMYMKCNIIVLCTVNFIFHRVYATLMLSPGMHTNVHERRVYQRREKEKLRPSTVECKKQRHDLKKLKSSQVS